MKHPQLSIARTRKSGFANTATVFMALLLLQIPRGAIAAVLHTGNQPGWQLVSSPFSPTQSLTQLGISADAWQPSQNQYAVTPTAPADTFHLGQGYWIFVTGDISLPETGAVADTSQPFQISLQPGWNMIGDPFPFSIPISQVSVTSSGSTVSLSNAVASQSVSPLFPYDPVQGSYNVLSQDSQTVDPWSGAWIFSFNPGTLSLNPAGQSGGGTISGTIN